MTPTALKAPERVETDRLVLRRPRLDDADAVFARYANDPDVSKYMAWRLHDSPSITRSFLEFSDAEWARWPAGPYLVESREDGLLLGGTGLAFETPHRAATGYVFAKDAWGQGFATESVMAMVDIARDLGVIRLYGLCHVDHAQSTRVLEKAGFTREGVLHRYLEFPNLPTRGPHDVWCYAKIFDENLR